MLLSVSDDITKLLELICLTSLYYSNKKYMYFIKPNSNITIREYQQKG